ncbi:hypothetical protein [Nonomuraea zeae]|uniref:hypothetical protein n=1 Tax=Nonomuraea zeae TaxID=1642303 RepID=UPI0014789D0C|nr:hypothetical protein [Nonomuraea zeae]
MTYDLQEIKALHDALPGPSATATATAKALLAIEVAAERTPPTGSAKKHRLLLRAGAVGLAAAATPASAAELLQEAATAAGRQQAPRPIPGPVGRGPGCFVAIAVRPLPVRHLG